MVPRKGRASLPPPASLFTAYCATKPPPTWAPLPSLLALAALCQGQEEAVTENSEKEHRLTTGRSRCC